MKNISLKLIFVIALILTFVGAVIVSEVRRAQREQYEMGEESSNHEKLMELGQAWEIYAADHESVPPRVKTLYALGTLPKKTFESGCDPFPKGWANRGYEFFPTKVSILDPIIFDGKNLPESYYQFGKMKGWAVMPGCNAKPFNPALVSGTFLGRFSRLEFDGSVSTREIPLKQNWASGGQVFNDDGRDPRFP